jgi:branched-chain amino acid transport system permease protein
VTEGVLSLLPGMLAVGATYALVALGFVLVINAVGAVNFAHGELVMLGGVIAVGFATLIPEDTAMPGLVLLPLVLLASAAAGMLLMALAYLPLRRAPPVSVFISTIAVGLIIQHGVTVGFGPEPKVGPPLVRSLDQSWMVVLVASVAVVAVHLLLARTQFGRMLRAAAQDPDMARAVGVPVLWTIAASFALAGALAGIAGLLSSNQYFVTPTDGANLMLKAYIATVIGGWGRIWGAALGAFLIAIFETVIALWLSFAVAEAALYIAVFVVLAVRPRGLFDEAEGRRA